MTYNSQLLINQFRFSCNVVPYAANIEGESERRELGNSGHLNQVLIKIFAVIYRNKSFSIASRCKQCGHHNAKILFCERFGLVICDAKS